jgi:hypothetical protein
MDQQAEGKAVLITLGIDRFVPITDQAYDTVRRLVNRIGTQP